MPVNNKQFLQEELPMILRRMKLLEISEEDFIKAFRQTHATV